MNTGKKRCNIEKFLQELRDHGKIGLANCREHIQSPHEIAWWLQWLEWESMWISSPPPSDVITWNIGPQGVDLSLPQIAQALSKGAAVVMLKEVSFHPGERRRIKNMLKVIGPEYWCVMETSQRVRAGKEDLKVGVPTKNYAAPWVYAVATFLHKDEFCVNSPTNATSAGRESYFSGKGEVASWRTNQRARGHPSRGGKGALG